MRVGFEECDSGTEDMRGLPGCPCASGEHLQYGKCRLCAWETSVNSTGYLNGCESCAAGTFSDEFGQAECKICLPKQRYSMSRGWLRCPPVFQVNTDVVDSECKCKGRYRVSGGTSRIPTCAKNPGELMAVQGG